MAPLQFLYCIPIGPMAPSLWLSNRRNMSEKPDVWQGTLSVMVLKTLQTMGPLHGYGIARRIEQTSGDLLSVNYGTLYPSLLKLEQDGNILRENRANGNRQPQSSRVSCHRGRSLDEATARLVFAIRRAVPQGAAGPRVGGRARMPSPDAHRGQSSFRHE